MPIKFKQGHVSSQEILLYGCCAYVLQQITEPIFK